MWQNRAKRGSFLTNNVEKTHIVALHFDQQIEMVKAHARRPFLGLFGKFGPVDPHFRRRLIFCNLVFPWCLCRVFRRSCRYFPRLRGFLSGYKLFSDREQSLAYR